MISETTRHARRVLSAWQARDKGRIEPAVTRAAAHCAAETAHPLDAERRELLGTILAHIRTGQPTTAALHLLQHLSA
jgi:hypothetical protein